MNLTRLTDWQSDNFSLLKNKRLNRMVLPYSHDAGAYTNKIRMDLPAAVYWSPVIEFLHKYDIFYPFLEKWTACQDKNFYDQLKSGIRSFDWRLCMASDGKWRFHHSFMADTLDDVLEQFIKFFKEHPKEFVTIKIMPGGCPWYKFRGWEDYMKKYKNGKFYKLVSSSSHYRMKYSSMIYGKKNICFVSNNDKERSYNDPANKYIHTAIPYAEKWLINTVPKTSYYKYLIYHCNITPSTPDFITSFICSGNVFVLVICLIILAFRLHYIIKSSLTRLGKLIKFITDPAIIIVGFILVMYFTGCSFMKGFHKGLQGREPEFQNKMIAVLKRNEKQAKLLSAVAMDFPTTENIKYVISLNK